MWSSVNEFHAAKLQEEIRVACRSLEKIGYESVVIVASQDSHTEMGSDKGRQFIDSFDLVVEFLSYCQREENYGHQENIVTVDLGNILDQDAQLATPGSDDEPGLDKIDSDFDEILEKPKLPTEGTLMSKAGLVVVKHEPTMEKVTRKASSQDSQGSPDKTIKTPVISPKSKKKMGAKTTKKQKNSPSTRKKTYDCDKCDKKYARFESLTFHTRSVHTGERPYKCKDCGKGFVSRGHLKSHKFVHSNLTPFACKLCGQLFKRRDYLWHHELTHSTAARYSCDQCGKICTDSAGLKRHIMIHTDERPHCCETCGRSFRIPRALIEHQRVHTGEMPFTCEVCGASFRRKKNMVTHQKRRHDY